MSAMASLPRCGDALFRSQSSRRPGEGSLAELETQLRLIGEIGYCSPVEADGTLAFMEELRKMLNSLRRRLSSAR